MKNGFRSWSDVRVFLTVVREGSTLAASRKLGMAQPTTARRIEVLEHETGLTLFERDTRGFKPTEEALALLPIAEQIEKHAEDFARKSRELAKPKSIRITAPGYFSDRVMEILGEFTALHPGVGIEFLHSIRLLDLLAGEADVAFRVSARAPDDKLICRKIGVEHWALYGGQNYGDKFGFPNSIDDLKGHRFVTFEHNYGPDMLHKWLVQNLSPDQIVTSFGEYDLMLASIRAGHGLGLIHTRYAERDQGLIRCFENIEELSRPFTMLVPPDAYRRPEVKAFTKFFAPRFAAHFE